MDGQYPHSFGSGAGTTFAGGDTIRLEVQGTTTLRCRKNGVQFASFTDTNITTGKPGIGYSSAADTAADASIRSWAAGDFSSAGSVSLAATGGGMRAMSGGMRSQSIMLIDFKLGQMSIVLPCKLLDSTVTHRSRQNWPNECLKRADRLEDRRQRIDGDRVHAGLRRH